ncbi:alpha/beta fold hydrolase [Erythrobacter sp. YT30]|uniref:alpha/beta fold hydrolase n=1 Tax=Erythrobacter sp. YT30 TaxID=1735012 RepID=UPI00076CCB2B|nr:alpha/beta hydrolase [Erythrobacter sp. YT30]KWV90502.1 alpha/beta hydrolase [Erythrobacter sp. YT30]
MKWALRIVLGLTVVLGIAFLLLRTPDTDPAEMRAKYGGEPSQFVEIGNGVKVHLRDEGPRDAQAIVLLHGSAADLHTWEPWVEGLSDTFRVIRFDQVGHGLTGPDPEGDYSLDNFVSDIDEVADSLGLETFILAGSSMGGSHTAAYAMAHPERLAGAVLVGASGAPVRGDRTSSLTYKLAQTPGINQIMAQITPRSMIEDSFEEMVSNKTIMTDDVVDRYWELLRYPGNREATIARFSNPRTSFEAEQLAKVNVPALILCGEEDPLIPMPSCNWYDENWPRSRMVSYPGIGHLPHEETPEATLETLKEWMMNLSETT